MKRSSPGLTYVSSSQTFKIAGLAEPAQLGPKLDPLRFKRRHFGRPFFQERPCVPVVSHRPEIGEDGQTHEDKQRDPYQQSPTGGEGRRP